MKFTWLSNAPWAPTGYGNQTKVFVPRMKAAGHDPAIIAFYGLEGNPLNIGGIPIYPRGYNPYGLDVMSAHTQHWCGDKPHVMFSLMDAWVIDPKYLLADTLWIPWFPVDMEPLPLAVQRNIELAYKRLVFSEFGRKMVEESGLDCDYIPHGVDAVNTFYPGPKAEAREKMKWEQDWYVVGMVAANKGVPSRKALTQHLEGFAFFASSHREARLYLHTTKGENGEHGGVNLVEYARYLGIEDKLIFCDQYGYMLGFNDEYMRTVYQALDIHMLVSMGEGFGIPTLEAQACGTPVLTSEWTASGELCFSGSTVCKEDAAKWWTPLAAYQWVPRPGAIAEHLEYLYQYPASSTKARQGALKYDADRIMKIYWLPYLEKLSHEIL